LDALYHVLQCITQITFPGQLSYLSALRYLMLCSTMHHMGHLSKSVQTLSAIKTLYIMLHNASHRSLICSIWTIF